MTPRVLITGASGFVGGAVVRAALASERQPLLRLVEHRRSIETAGFDGRCRTVEADLGDPTSLRGLCEDVDLVVHCASQVGGDPEQCTAVNAAGTRALVAEAQRAGVRRLVYLSTASVYGRGVYRQAREEQLQPAPGSVTSESRAEAERAVLAFGGTVLRPHLVYGEGDRWVVPALIALNRALGATVDGWSAQLSMIDADSLGRLLLSTALSTRPELTGAAYHANHPEPVHCADLMAQVCSSFDVTSERGTMDLEQATGRLRSDVRSAHALAMMSTDHWFESTRLWALTGCRPGPGFSDLFPKHVPWYTAQLTPVPAPAEGLIRTGQPA
jgi:2-alkyl-3-oxoalkanoate reductase